MTQQSAGRPELNQSLLNPNDLHEHDVKMPKSYFLHRNCQDELQHIDWTSIQTQITSENLENAFSKAKQDMKMLVLRKS